MIYARQEGFDVFNCLDIMKNQLFLSDLHFGKGDGALNYYLYNYGLKTIEPSQVGLVML
jgi:glycylpeptide N-tetradecanoyltransferase